MKKHHKITAPERDQIAWWLACGGHHSGDGKVARPKSMRRYWITRHPIEPTNNRLERALRPAVIGCKVSQCSKTWSGADAFATFTSVIQTLLKKGAPSSVVEALADLFRVPRSQTASV